MARPCDYDELRRLVADGHTIKEIAEITGRTYCGTSRALRRAGLKPKKSKAGRPRTGAPKEIVDKIRHLFNAGYSDRYIGSEVGYCQEWVGLVRRTNGMWYKNRLVTDEELTSVYKETKSVEATANKVGMGKRRCSLRLYKLGLRIYRNRPAPPKEELIALVDAGFSKARIASRYGVGVTTVDRWRKTHGITYSVAHERAKAAYNKMRVTNYERRYGKNA